MIVQMVSFNHPISAAIGTPRAHSQGSHYFTLQKKQQMSGF
jgi:gamma-glutamyltranspeptidase